MIITYKFLCDTKETRDIATQYNNVKRVAYNYMNKNKSIKLSDVEKHCKLLNNIDLLDASIIKLAVNDAKSLKDKNSIIFSRKEFMKLKYNSDDKNKSYYKELKNSNMLFRGSSSDNNGNRKIELDIEHNLVIFKPKKDVKIPLKILGLSNKRKSELLKLQNLCKSKNAYFNLLIGYNSISISFDNSFLKTTSKYKIKNRILSLDLNPNSVGIVITENKKIIHKEIIDHLMVNNEKNDKRVYEKIQSSIYIVKLAKHYKCSHIAIEKLNIRSSNKGKGKYFNRLCNNIWDRNQQVHTIKKHAELNDISLLEIHPAYSSFIGCIMNETEFDSIAASIEIGRRAFELIKNGNYNLFPNIFNINNISTRWKKMISNSNIEDWKDLYNFFKNNTRHSYRNVFNRCNISIFSHRLISHKSKLVIYFI